MVDGSAMTEDNQAAAAAHPAPPAAKGDAQRVVVVEDVFKSYHTGDETVEVLRGASLALNRGETAALIGESGSGKSTLLHLIAGLDAIDAGAISVAGVALAGADDNARAELRRRTVSVIFQQFNLIPSLDVAANLRFYARLSGAVDEAWTQTVIERLGLAALTDRYPEQLSGGQQQRVAIGRSLIGRPPVILADEPTGNLDVAASDEVMALTKELVAESGASLLMVTHSMRLAEMLDRQFAIADGRIQ